LASFIGNCLKPGHLSIPEKIARYMSRDMHHLPSVRHETRGLNGSEKIPKHETLGTILKKVYLPIVLHGLASFADCHWQTASLRKCVAVKSCFSQTVSSFLVDHGNDVIVISLSEKSSWIMIL
jgi:hypothetical protein